MNPSDLFLGHVISGVVFVFLSIWWSINIFKDFYLSKCRGTSYTNRPWYTAPFCRTFPLDSAVKLIFSIVSIITLTNSYFVAPGDRHLNMVHFMMAIAVLINSICDLLKCYHVFPLPDGIEAASAVMAFLHSALLLYVHIVGRDDVDYFLHVLLVYLSVIIVFVIHLETCNRHSPMLSLIRAFLFQLFGTWMIHIGMTLYPPAHWNTKQITESFPSLPTLGNVFVLHSVANFICILTLGAVIWVYIKKKEVIHFDSIAEAASLLSINDKVIKYHPILNKSEEST